MSDLLELAERCETTTGPDRELDCLIHCAVKGWKVVYEGKDVFADMGPTMRRILVGWIDPGVVQRNFSMTSDSLAPNYTASLDAVMTLVPPCPEAGGDRWAVEVGSGFYGATAKLWHECSLKRHEGHAAGQHAAMARALCAAILRARAASADTHPKDGDVKQAPGDSLSGPTAESRDAQPQPPSPSE